MKNLKSEIKEWIFENLLLLLKFDETHTLVKFEKRLKNLNVYYDIQIKSKFKENTAVKDPSIKITIPKIRSEINHIEGEWIDKEGKTLLIGKDRYSEMFKIRSSIMNLSRPQWRIVKKLLVYTTFEEPYFITTIRDFYDTLGISGGMFISRRSEEEDRFVKLFYEYGNRQRILEIKTKNG
jgi:hypothetical protein